MGNALADIALCGWIPVVLGLFAFMHPRRAVIVAFLTAWLFLPMAGYQIPGLPDYTKMTATCAGVLLAVLVFDSDRLLRFRMTWLDVPMLTWCLCPMSSSLANWLGWYDGCSGVITESITWGLPYLIGRLYFTDLACLRELAIGIFAGGLVYVPLCLYEIRMSPQLHAMIYGFHQHSFAQTLRLGGWRPMVFMQHGLMVGMWMAGASLIGVWLWRTRTIRTVGGFRASWIVAILLLTTIACKSTGAIVLLGLGVSALLLDSHIGRRMATIGLVLAAPLYISARLAGQLDRQQIVALVTEWIDADRAESLDARMRQEELYSDKAMLQPWFGWGGWNRSAPTDDEGNLLTRGVDSHWIIALSTKGLVGLVLVMIVILMPSVLFFWRWPPSEWLSPRLAPAASLAVLLVIYMIDCALNAMINPVFILAMGGLAALPGPRGNPSHTSILEPPQSLQRCSQRHGQQTNAIVSSPISCAQPLRAFGTEDA